MRIIDITLELSERLPVYENDPRISIQTHANVQDDGYAVTKLSLGSHSGTHVDAPCHYLENGRTVTDIPLASLIGKCTVVDCNDFVIRPNTQRLLIKGNTKSKDTLNIRQAEALMNAGVRVVGTDGLSIGNDDVHQTLLEADCVILEGLDLTRVDPGDYVLCALPLKISCDGAPLRACLLEPPAARGARA